VALFWFFYRQGFVTPEQSMYSLVEEYLPLEYRQEIIPIARSGNVIEPKRWCFDIKQSRLIFCWFLRWYFCPQLLMKTCCGSNNHRKMNSYLFEIYCSFLVKMLSICQHSEDILQTTKRRFLIVSCQRVFACVMLHLVCVVSNFKILCFIVE